LEADGNKILRTMEQFGVLEIVGEHRRNKCRILVSLPQVSRTQRLKRNFQVEGGGGTPRTR